MNYKTKDLINKIYSNFVKGVYGLPKIPSKSDIINKLEEITSKEMIPITKYKNLTDIDIDYIFKSFSDIIDDIEILYSSIEDESIDILEQLTNSLKEHNGIKRELKNISSRANDIKDGNIGEELLKYKFTESFNDSLNINLNKSDTINFDNGFFTIDKSSLNVVDMSHYYGTKLEFNIVENFSQVKKYEYIGNSDASIIFNQNDVNSLNYKISTISSTPLKVTTSFQLTSDRSLIDINSVILDVDSNVSKGFIKLYYKDNFEWKVPKNNSIIEIKNNKVTFDFPTITTNQLKLEFIKNYPDSFEDNLYFIIINNLIINKSISKRTSKLISNYITPTGYSNELVNISTIKVSGNYEIPSKCNIKLYVSNDIKISGSFVDSNSSPVNYKSPNIYKFDKNYSGYTYLSEIDKVDKSISGVIDYYKIDYNWKEIKLYDNTGKNTPNIINFNSNYKKDLIDNSIYNNNVYLYGDDNYSGTYTLSGWVNTDNPDWSTLEDYVNSGVFVSGVNVASLLGIAWEDIEDNSGNINPSILADYRYSGQWIGYSSGIGYPFGYTIDRNNITFNGYTNSINGWWRPYYDAVTPTGIHYNYASGYFLSNDYSEIIPDFVFNNKKFYKIYKFGFDNDVIEQSIKLYSYQERPISNMYDYYPCNFSWNYKKGWIDKIGSLSEQTDSSSPSEWTNYYLTIPSGLIDTNEEYIINGISDIKIHNTNSYLSQNEYQLIYDNNIPSKILLKGLNSRTGLIPSGISFDYNYKYKIKNDYLSSWVGFAIVYPGSDGVISIPNNKIISKNTNIIKNILVENIDEKTSFDITEDNGGLFIINLKNETSSNTHYKISIFCSSNSSNGFCANNWIPYKGNKNSTIQVSSGIKLVNKLNNYTLVNLSNLLYNPSNYKVAVYEQNNEKFLIIKEPDKDLVPGYYFDSINKTYSGLSTNQIENRSHYIRNILINNNKYYYTTGSKNDNNIYLKNMSGIDITWNNGKTLNSYPNYTGYSSYSHHSTFSYPINIDDSSTQSFVLYDGDIDPTAPTGSGEIGTTDWLNWMGLTYSGYSKSKSVTITDYNRGHLFYNTSENLPSYYSISYRTNNEVNNRFLYKIEMSSDDKGSVVPKIKSLNFIINEEIS